MHITIKVSMYKHIITTVKSINLKEASILDKKVFAFYDTKYTDKKICRIICMNWPRHYVSTTTVIKFY